MKTLILMRHAKSDSTNPGQSDKERGLHPRGRRTAALMGAWLTDEGYLPEAALVSGAVRTRETWDRLGLKAEATFDDSLYLAEADAILHAIQNAPACNSLLVLGHNPGMEAAMGMMTMGENRVSAPTCATAVLTVPATDWRDVRFDSASLIAYETPKSLV